MTASGRKLMAANGCFGDAEPKGSRAAHLNGRFAACFVGDVVISAVTLAELEFGIACSSLAVQATNQSRRAARLKLGQQPLRSNLFDSTHHFSPRGLLICNQAANNKHAALRAFPAAIFPSFF